MPRTPKGDVSKREKAKAIKLLAATVDDESAPIYLRVQSARSLLQVKPTEKPADDPGEFPTGAKVIDSLAPGQPFVHEGDGPAVILPSIGRASLVEQRERRRLERLAEVSIVDEDEALLTPPSPRKSAGRDRLRMIRASRKATRDAPFGG